MPAMPDAQVVLVITVTASAVTAEHITNTTWELLQPVGILRVPGEYVVETHNSAVLAFMQHLPIGSYVWNGDELWLTIE